MDLEVIATLDHKIAVSQRSPPSCHWKVAVQRRVMKYAGVTVAGSACCHSAGGHVLGCLPEEIVALDHKIAASQRSPPFLTLEGSGADKSHEVRWCNCGRLCVLSFGCCWRHGILATLNNELLLGETVPTAPSRPAR